jgi:hypothetical protein
MRKLIVFNHVTLDGYFGYLSLGGTANLRREMAFQFVYMQMT